MSSEEGKIPISTNKKARKNSSHVWNHFFKSRTDPTKCYCLHCENTFLLNTTTTNLSKHLQKNHHIAPFSFVQGGQQKISDVEKAKLDALLCHWLSMHHLPYSFVNHPELKEFVSTLCPGYQMASVESLKVFFYFKFDEYFFYYYFNSLPSYFL